MVDRIRCFLLEPTDLVRVYARRYSRENTPDCCPRYPGKYSYHTRMVFLFEEPAERDEDKGYTTNGLKPELPHDDPRWPVACECGYVFQEGDSWQRFTEAVWRRADNALETTLSQAPAGALWYAPWCDQFHRPQGPHVLIVKLPDGSDWEIDGQSSNCGIPEDRSQEKHHCWVIHGTPPDITVDKNGVTCSAGAGSIQTARWHGFLQDGYLIS